MSKIFITGTDTDVGKTLVSSWLCLHTGYDYYKPVQSGNIVGTDSDFVRQNSGVNVFPEAYNLRDFVSPHLAAKNENISINLDNILLPDSKKMLVEGAGGVYVPLNDEYFIIDLIKKFNIPTIVVARPSLGTINHTILTVKALRENNIPVPGVIVNGGYNKNNIKDIACFGDVEVLACVPEISKINREELEKIKLPKKLREVLQ